MTHLGIARVFSTKGEPASKEIPKKKKSKPRIPKRVSPGNTPGRMRRKRVMKPAEKSKAITINIHNHSAPATPVVKQQAQASPVPTRRKAVAKPAVKSSMASQKRTIAKPTVKSRVVSKKRTIAKPTVKSRVVSKKRTIAKPTVKSRVASRKRTIAKPAVKSRIASRKRTIARPAVKSRVASRGRTVTKPTPRKVASKPRAGKKIARGVFKVATAPQRLAAKGLSKLVRRIRK